MNLMDFSGESTPSAPLTVAVISLWQPYASLIFTSEPVKRHETRSFRYPARLEGKTIAIHATASFPAARHISPELHALCIDTFGCGYNRTLPLGGILGTVRLDGCYPTESLTPDDDDLIAGDWGPERFAWRLTEPRAFPGVYLPIKGKQGWWNVPERVIAEGFHATRRMMAA